MYRLSFPRQLEHFCENTNCRSYRTRMDEVFPNARNLALVDHAIFVGIHEDFVQVTL